MSDSLVDLGRLMQGCLDVVGAMDADDLLVVRLPSQQYPGQPQPVQIFLRDQALRRIYAALPQLLGGVPALLPAAYDLLVSEVAPLDVERRFLESLLDPDEVSQDCIHEVLHDTPRSAAMRAMVIALLRTCSIELRLEGS